MDFDRTLSGSTKEKIAQGLPLISNPFEAGLQALVSGSRRNNYSRVLGKNNELINPIVQAVRAEGGNAVLADNLLTHLGGTQFYPKYMQDFAATVTSIQVARKLALAVIANMSQTVNTATMAGIGRTTKGAARAVRGENRQRLAQALGVHETVIRSIGQPFVDDVGLRSGASRFADAMLRRSGFTLVEKMNRLIAGNTGALLVRDLVSKGTAGRLRGNTLDSSRRIMRDLGLDLDDLVRKTLNQGDDFLRSEEFLDIELQAAFRLAQRTQFIPSKFLKPTAWTHPIGRVVFQFKNFAINQSRFVADQVFSEAALGNMRPLATYFALSPIAGEIVQDSRSLVKLRDRKEDGFTRVMDNFFSAGGLGLFSDTMRAFRFPGGGTSAFFGPTAGDAVDLAGALLRGDIEEAAGTLATDQPLFDAVVALGTVPVLTTALALQYAETSGDVDTVGERTTVDLGELRTRDKERPR